MTDRSAGAAIELDRLTRRFARGADPVVDEASFSVAAGEPLVLLGPSGAGKTTLLRLIAGLDRADEGTIRFDGEDVGGRSPRDRAVAMVFQDRSVYPHLTVRRNLAFGLRQWGVGRAEAGRRVDEAMALLELADLADRKPHQLSGGERQRLALGRAIVRRPRVLLLDEPLSHLDEPLRWRMRTMLRRAVESIACTSILVTHDQDDAFTFGGRAALMDGGKILQAGPADDLWQAPASLAAARFIGRPPINELPLDLAGSEAGGRLAKALGPIRDGGGAAEPLAASDRLVLCARPMDVSLEAIPKSMVTEVGSAADDTGLEAGVVHLPGNLIGQEIIAGRRFALVRIAPGVVWRAASSETVASPGNPGPSENVLLAVPVDRILLFRAETGERVALAAEEPMKTPMAEIPKKSGSGD